MDPLAVTDWLAAFGGFAKWEEDVWMHINFGSVSNLSGTIFFNAGGYIEFYF